MVDCDSLVVRDGSSGAVDPDATRGRVTGEYPDVWLPTDSLEPLADIVGTTTGCGWTFGGYALPLIEAPSGDALGWWVRTTSTYTVRFSDGRCRMYFQSPTLGRLRQDIPRWWADFPVKDRDEVDKYGGGAEDEEALAEWWKATLDPGDLAATGYDGGPPDTANLGDDVTNLRFCGNYISFIDSPDGGRTFPVKAPQPAYEPSDGDWSSLGDDDWDFDEAGWGSTAIPSQRCRQVYRDVSVIELDEGQTFLMFAVQCTSQTRNEEDEESYGCSICVDQRIDDAGTYSCNPGYTRTDVRTGDTFGCPTTRLVFFVSGDPDFRNPLGPFDAVSFVPDPSDCKWFGVPQAFTDPSRRFLFLALGEFGFHVARMADVSGLIAHGRPEDVPNTFFNLSDLAEMDAVPPALGLGRFFFPRDADGVDIVIEDPSERLEGVDPVAGRPNLQDPHFVFLGGSFLGTSGRLSLFWVQLVDGVADALAQAVAFERFDPDVLDDLLDLAVGWTEPADPHWAWTPDTARMLDYADDMLLRFVVRLCDPFAFADMVGGHCTCMDPDCGAVGEVVIADPDVYWQAGGGYRVNFNGGPLNGLVYATASTSEVWVTCSDLCGMTYPDRASSMDWWECQIECAETMSRIVGPSGPRPRGLS